MKIIFTLVIIMIACQTRPNIKMESLPEKSSGINEMEDVDVVEVDIDNALVKQVVTREDMIDYFSCTDCHDEPKDNWTMEALIEDGEHDDILEIYKHAPDERMDCMTCHKLNDRDHLQINNKIDVSYDESFKLCSQCHSTKYNDWKNGAHGKRIGNWDKVATYINCVVCHNPHNPSSAYPVRKPAVKAYLIPPYKQIHDDTLKVSH